MKKVNCKYAGKIFTGFLGTGGVCIQIGDKMKKSPISEIQFLPPVINPGKIICVGMNYPPLITQEVWNPPPFPILFQKPASTLVGSGEAIILPGISRRVLYEGELAVIIGSRVKNTNVDDALEHVSGFTIANDVGAADIEARSSQWASGKMFDTFCPLGPALVTLDEIPDPDDLIIKTTLNGQVVQESTTREMIFDVPFLISYISQLTTLEPNDVILTGSPKRAGDAPDPRIPLNPGDTISIEIDSLGVLENSVVAEGLEDG